jgi:hypothetical protein
MTSGLLGTSTSAFANAPAVLVTLLAVLLLLGLRAWCQTMGIVLARQALHLLDGAIVVLGFLFLALVTIRFVTVG